MWLRRPGLWPYRTWHRFHSDPSLFPSLSGTPGNRDLQWTHSSGPPQIHTPEHSPLPPGSQGMDGAAQDKAGEHVSCPRRWQHSSELLSCWELALLFPALRLNTREHSPACTWLHTLCRKVSVRMGSSYRDRVPGATLPTEEPLSCHLEQRWHCLHGESGASPVGADLTPSARPPHPRLGTSDYSWQLLRRSTWAAEQRAGRVFCVPCGRTQV